nr:hypothetical protein [Tanacetum cinerariifolium]
MSSSAIPIPADLAPTPRIIPRGTQGTAWKIVRPQPATSLGYRASIARWRAAPLSTWSPTTSSPALVPLVLSSIHADHLSPQPVIPPVYPEQTVKERLDEQEEIGDESLRVSLRTARTGHAKMQRQAKDTVEKLWQTGVFSREERIKPLGVRALVMTINLNLPPQILDTRAKAIKEESVERENLRSRDKEFETRPKGGHYVLRSKVDTTSWRIKGFDYAGIA